MENQSLEALIKRHAKGERGPDLMALLDAAAWDGFHDPWERRPITDAASGPEDTLAKALQVMEEEDLPEDFQARRPRRPPQAPAPQVAEKLIAYLEVHRWAYTQDGDGAFLCTPNLGGMQGRDLTLRLHVDGRPARHLVFLMTSTWAVPEAARREASRLCDQWNHANHPLGSRLEMPLLCPEGPPTGTLMLQGSLQMPPQLTLKALVAFLDACVLHAREFWATARQEAAGWPQ